MFRNLFKNKQTQYLQGVLYAESIDRYLRLEILYEIDYDMIDWNRHFQQGFIDYHNYEEKMRRGDDYTLC